MAASIGPKYKREARGGAGAGRRRRCQRRPADAGIDDLHRRHWLCHIQQQQAVGAEAIDLILPGTGSIGATKCQAIIGGLVGVARLDVEVVEVPLVGNGGGADGLREDQSKCISAIGEQAGVEIKVTHEQT